MTDVSEPLPDVDDFEKYPPVKNGIIKCTSDYVKAVDGVSFDIERGETLALIGESGSGKSTAARTIIGLTGATGGTVRSDGEDIANVADEQLARLRSHVQMVFQGPTSSLNSRRTIGKSLAISLKAHGVVTSDLRERVVDLFKRVKLNDGYWSKYPHELSGGQKQRVNIARAFTVEPELPLLDESTSALDASVQAKIIVLLEDLQMEFGLAYLFITHNLSLVRDFTDETAVMYLGEIQEHGPM